GRRKLPAGHRPRIIQNARLGIDELKARGLSTEWARLIDVNPNSYSAKASREKVSGPRLYVVNHLPGRGTDHVVGLTQIYAGPAAASAGPLELTDIMPDGRTLENRRWSGLSAIYKIWQDGPRSDIVGFCHYRRYFYFGKT